jgi:hypothetical protein
MWGPRVRVKPEKKKKKKKGTKARLGLVGLSAAQLKLGSGLWVGLGVGLQAGSSNGSGMNRSGRALWLAGSYSPFLPRWIGSPAYGDGGEASLGGDSLAPDWFEHGTNHACARTQVVWQRGEAQGSDAKC